MFALYMKHILFKCFYGLFTFLLMSSFCVALADSKDCPKEFSIPILKKPLKSGSPINLFGTLDKNVSQDVSDETPDLKDRVTSIREELKKSNSYMSKKHVKRVYTETGTSLIAGFWRSLNLAINSINKLPYDKAKSLYIVLMTFKTIIYQDELLYEYYKHIEKASSHLTYSITNDPFIEEILGISEIKDFSAKLKEEKESLSKKTPINLGNVIYSTYTKTRFSTQSLDMTLQDRKNIPEVIFNTLTTVTETTKDILPLHIYTVYCANIQSLTFMREFKFNDMIEDLDFLKSTITSRIIPYHFVFYDSLSQLVSMCSIEDFKAILDIITLYSSVVITNVNTNKINSISEEKTFIFSMMTSDFISFVNDFINSTLKTNGRGQSLKSLFELLKNHRINILQNYYKHVARDKDVEILNVNSNIYHDDLVSMLIALHYWLFSNINDENKTSTLDEATLKQNAKDIYELYLTLDEFNKHVLVFYLNYILRIYENMQTRQAITELYKQNVMLSDFIIEEIDRNNPDLNVIVKSLYLLYHQPESIKNFVRKASTLDSFDTVIYSNIIKVLLSHQIFSKILTNDTRVDLSSHPQLIEDMIEQFKSVHPNIYTSFIKKLAQWTKTPNELLEIVSKLVELENFNAVNTLFSNLNVDSLLNTTETKNKSVDNTSLEKLVPILMSLPKIPLPAKKLIYLYLLQKDNLTFGELDFILSTKNNFNIDVKHIASKISSLPLDDILQCLKNRIYTDFPDVKQQLALNLVKFNPQDFNSLDDDQIKLVVLFLLNSSTIFSFEKTLISILKQREKLLQSFISQCSQPGILSNELSLMKELLIRNGLMKKIPKIKRDIITKVSTSFIKQGILKSSEVESVISALTEGQDVESAVALTKIFNKLVSDLSSTQGLNRGKQEVREQQKSLDLILKMSQNFSIDSYPLLQQVYYSNLSNESFLFLIENVSKYKLKDKIYSILTYWIHSNRVNPTNFDFAVNTILNLHNSNILSKSQLYNICVLMLKKDGLSSNHIKNLCSILIAVLKEDIKVAKTNKASPQPFKYLTHTNIIKDLVPIVSKYLSDASELRSYLQSRLILFSTPNTQTLDEIDIRLLKLNKKLIDSLDNLTLYKKLIVLSILSDEAYLYLKNNESLYASFLLSIKKLNPNNTPLYILNLLAEIEKRLEETISLKDTIEEGIITISNWPSSDFESDDALLFREKISIKESLLYEINQEYLPVDFSSKDIIGLGYDIFSTSGSNSHYIEVKSKVSLFSIDYPPSISLNEARVAINTHKNPNMGEYLIYLVPLNIKERQKYGKVIIMSINWTRLEFLFDSMKDPFYDNPNFQIIDSNKRIFLKDFTENLYLRK